MYMTDEEALKACEEMIASCKRGPVEEWRPGFLDAAATALREKVAAKKPKRPTLEEMEKTCRTVDAFPWQEEHLRAAADLIKAVREDTVKELKRLYHGSVISRKVSWEMDGLTTEAWALARLRALGEDA